MFRLGEMFAAGLMMISLVAVPIRVQAAAIHTEIHVDVPPAFAWAAIRDVGAVHTRLVRGFVVNTVLADGVRTA